MEYTDNPRKILGRVDVIYSDTEISKDIQTTEQGQKVRQQIPTAMSEETTKRVNCHENGNLPLFCIEKDTRGGAKYAPFACVLMAEARGFEPLSPLRLHDFQSCPL